MGEIAEAFLNGDFCQGCGEYLGDGNGYSVFCRGCKRRGDDAPVHPSKSTAALQLEFQCGGRRAYARFNQIVAASTAKRGVNWNDAPALHGKLLGRGFITRAKDGKAWVSSKGMEAHRRVNGD